MKKVRIREDRRDGIDKDGVTPTVADTRREKKKPESKDPTIRKEKVPRGRQQKKQVELRLRGSLFWDCPDRYE